MANLNIQLSDVFSKNKLYFGIVSHLQKYYKGSTEFPHTSHPISPKITHLRYHNTVLKSKKPTSGQYCSRNSRLSVDCGSICINVLFAFRDPCGIPRCPSLSPQPSLGWAGSLAFHGLRGVGEVFCRGALRWGFSEVLPRIGLE